jgi:hypothetical protein
MKRHFGNAFSRLLRGGTTLSGAEHEVLVRLISELPPPLRGVVESQFTLYNLVQRESDGRALNFYLMSGMSPTNVGLPTLVHEGIDVPLVRLHLEVAGDNEPLHAVLTAVRGRAFSVTLNRPVAATISPTDLLTKHVTQAWRSNFRIGDA